MIASTSFFETMTNWVGLTKATQISGLDKSNVFRNAMAGRITFRVREGHLSYYEPIMREFHGAPMGNPNHRDDDAIAIKRADQKKVMAIREEMESKYEDVVYEFERINGWICVIPSVFHDRQWKRLPPRRIAKC